MLTPQIKGGQALISPWATFESYHDGARCRKGHEMNEAVAVKMPH